MCKIQWAQNRSSSLKKKQSWMYGEPGGDPWLIETIEAENT